MLVLLLFWAGKPALWKAPLWVPFVILEYAKIAYFIFPNMQKLHISFFKMCNFCVFYNFYDMIFLLNQRHQGSQENQKTKVESREKRNIVFALARVMLEVFAEGDETCQGCDQGSCTANVHTEQ